MSTRRVSVLLIGLLAVVAGCAAPARSSRMVAEVATPAPVTLRERISVTFVVTPDLKPPVHPPVDAVDLRQAVEESLQHAGYLSVSRAAAAMLLEVALIYLENGAPL